MAFLSALLVVLAADLLFVPQLTQAQSSGPTVNAVAVTSDAGDGDTCGLGEIIRVTVAFGKEVDVTGAPQLKIDMDPAEWGEKQAGYESETGTATLAFAYTVVEPNIST